MAEILTEWPKTERRGKGNGQYARFLDGQIYRVVAGVDVPSADPHMAPRGFYAAGNKLGRHVRCCVESRDPLTLIVQAVPKDAK